MSYREKPILKLYKYENNSFILQAIIDDYQECSFEDNLYEAGQFSITINFNIPNSQLFQRGLFIQFGNSWKFGEITKIQDQIGEEGKGSQFRIITGFDARYILKRRVIKNMNSNGLWVMTGKGEIVLRNLINDQAGTNAEEKRKLPIINTIPNSETAIGKEYSASEQFSNLYEVCKTIATQSEIGWRLEFNGTSLNLVCFEGTDRTQTVQFSTSFDSLANGEFIDSSESFANAIYVGGKGQNDDRDIYEGESAIEGDSPSGLDRFESWDNQSSMTTESEYETEALSMLNQYGQTLTMSGNGLAKCPYEYEKEYFVGDKIKIAFSSKSANAQILSVTEHWAFGAYEINFSFGKPLPDLNAQLQLMLRKIQTASNKTNSKDSVRWYDIPTDTAMPASDVTYNTIGFIGNVGEGATFTLYRDSSGTGSKTYHVYFKQLGGSGKLTLTTGVSGASNLVMNPGTYVAIIYVDENGNITSQGMTATGVIESGNNQPVESGAVAEEISNLTEVTKSSDNSPYSQRVNADKDKSFINKLIGASFAVNQMIKNGNFANGTTNWSNLGYTVTISASNGVMTATIGENYGGIRQQTPQYFINHKYLFFATIKASSQRNNSVGFGFSDFNSSFIVRKTFSVGTSYTFCTFVGQLASGSPSNYYFMLYDVRGGDGVTLNIKDVNAIDLTQMFGSAIADRIYAMEQATAGSGVAWIKSFGFFNNAYYATDEGSIQNVKPSAHKVSTSVVKWFTKRNTSSQYAVCLYAEAILKPNTNYILYFRGANDARIYTNEAIFTTVGTATLNGSLQSMTLKTKTELPYANATRFNNGWAIFKNRGGNTVVPNFTEFYIVEEGVNVDHSFSQSIPLADTELRGLPKLDVNNNLYFDGDIYYPNGDVIRKYGVVDLGSLTWTYNSPTEGINTFYSNDINSLIKAPATNNDIPSVICALYPAISWNDVRNSKYGVSVLYGGQLRISDPDNTYNKNANTFKTTMNGVYLIYELIAPTSETVAGYSNPHTLIRKGAEEFVDNRSVPLPVGHETEYAKLPSWLSNNVIFL